jgi:hypothetical protein
MSFRQNVRSAKRPFGKMSVGKMSVRKNVFRQNVFRQSVFRQNVRVPDFEITNCVRKTHWEGASNKKSIRGIFCLSGSMMRPTINEESDCLRKKIAPPLLKK